MSTLASATHPLSFTIEKPREEVRPPAKGGPVLMADCMTPVGGETLLSLLWKRWDQNTPG